MVSICQVKLWLVVAGPAGGGGGLVVDFSQLGRSKKQKVQRKKEEVKSKKRKLRIADWVNEQLKCFIAFPLVWFGEIYTSFPVRGERFWMKISGKQGWGVHIAISVQRSAVS